MSLISKKKKKPRIPIVFYDEESEDWREITLKVDSMNDEAWKKLHERIKKKWGTKFGLEFYSLHIKTTINGKKFDKEIKKFGDLQNAWENQGRELVIIVEKEAEADTDTESESDSDQDLPAMPVQPIPKVEPEEEKEIHYDIKNPLVICIGISTYPNLDCDTLTTGCEINTETILKLFINKYKYDLKLAIHNQNQNVLSLKKDDILSKLAEARDTILKSVGSKSQIDGLIIALSGHGRGNNIYCSDYETEGSKKINIGDIQSVFHGENNDEYKFPDIPKIVIIDAFPPDDDDDDEKTDSMDNNMIKYQNWYCFCASSTGYSDEYDIEKANEEGGFLINAIKDIMEDPLCYGNANKQNQWRLPKIIKKIQTKAWIATGRMEGKGMTKKIAICHQTENIKGPVQFKMGLCHNEFRKMRCITNPVIVNIGVSIYKEEKYNNLEECAKDVITMNKLWKQYGFTRIFSNENGPKLTSRKFWNVMEEAQTAFKDKKENHDAFIISFSGHGDKESIWLSDYNGKKGNVSLSELKKYFSPPTVQRKNQCPRIAIIDACRGSEEASTKYKGNNSSVHPMQNWVTLYSNSTGYKSQNAYDGGMLITSVRDVLGNIKSATNKEWSQLQKDIGIEVEKKSESAQCFTPEGSFNHYDLFLMPKDTGKGGPNAKLLSTNTQSSENTK